MPKGIMPNTIEEEVLEEGSNKDELYSEAENEGAESAVLEELAGKEEVTVEDLRRIPGSDKYSDEQLTKMWEEYNKPEGEEKVETPVFKPSFPIYDEKGNKIEDFTKLKLEDVLAGKVQIGYTANKQEQKKALNDLIRVAQLGHHNEQRIAGTIAERNQLAQQLNEVRQTVNKYENDRRLWESALVALTQGNAEPIKALAKAYGDKLTEVPNVPEGFVKREDIEAETQAQIAGMNFVNNYLIPEAQKISQSYGAKFEEVANVAKWMIEQEGEFLTREKLDMIMQYDVPNYLEQHGYKAGNSDGTVVQQGGNNELAELKKTVEALQAQLASGHNSQIEKLKTRKVPPAGGGSVPPAGGGMPAFKSRQQMKEWLQSKEN